MDHVTISKCDICDCYYRTTIQKASEKICRLCRKYKTAETRFHPIVLLGKVLINRDIFSLSSFELSELFISQVFVKHPSLLQHPLLNLLHTRLSERFDH